MTDSEAAPGQATVTDSETPPSQTTAGAATRRAQGGGAAGVMPVVSISMPSKLRVGGVPVGVRVVPSGTRVTE